MFIRQFSLRTLLAIITLCAAVSLILSFAVQGRAWAFSLFAILLMLAVGMLVQGFVFWLVWLFSVAADYRQRYHLAAAQRGTALPAAAFGTASSSAADALPGPAPGPPANSSAALDERSSASSA